MKKIILTITTLVAASLSGFSQGLLYFESEIADGYVVIDPSGDLSPSKVSYTVATSFDVACYSLNVASTAGLTGLDAYGYLNPAFLVSDGFTQDTVDGSLTPLTGAGGNFGTTAPLTTATITGATTSAN